MKDKELLAVWTAMRANLERESKPEPARVFHLYGFSHACQVAGLITADQHEQVRQFVFSATAPTKH